MEQPITEFLRRHYRHFNAATLVDAAQGWVELLERGGTMFVTLAGAMSTAELGLSLAEMIRQGKVGAISCTGANLEEDIFNLVAHEHYERIPHYRDLTPADEQALLDRHLNRVTDTCIPEEEAFRRLERSILRIWQEADEAGERLFPHEFLYEVLTRGWLEERYQIDPANSWMVAAAEADLPLFVPGWEDSTMGNVFAARVMDGSISDPRVVRGGIEYMIELADWYSDRTTEQPVGFFQIGGGSPATSPSAWSPCSNRTCGAKRRCGPTSARSRIRQPATAPTRARFPTRRSPGANSPRTRRSTSSNPTPPSSHR
jgi:deoxyhypusine synthase